MNIRVVTLTAFVGSAAAFVFYNSDSLLQDNTSNSQSLVHGSASQELLLQAAGQSLSQQPATQNMQVDKNKLAIVDSLASNGIDYLQDPTRPWLQDSLRAHPDSPYWRAQVKAHLAQARTDGWQKFEEYSLNKSRDPIKLPTFSQMLASEHAESVLTVRLNDDVEVKDALLNLGLTHKAAINRQLVTGGIHTYQIPASLSFSDALELVNAHPSVAYAEPDYLVQLALAPNEPNVGGSAWWLDQINAYEAWDVSTDARDIGPIAVYDQGILRSHEDLQGNFWINPDEVAGNGVDDDGNGVVDDINGRTNTVFGSHGTPVSGTICAHGNNGIGYAGSAWRCNLMDTGGPLSFSSAVSDAMASLVYATDKGSRISNHSWGISGDYSQAFKDLIGEMAGKDHLLVIASHNFNSNIDGTPVYPASYDDNNILSIAASDQSEGRVSYSNYGVVSVDLAAPTEFTTVNSSGGYAGFSGTSQATPVVTGAVALMWAQNPSWDYVTVKQRTMDAARPVNAWTGLTVTGGILDMHAMMQNINVDTDKDGLLDNVDPDDDNDGVLDADDAFPKDKDESVDTDKDGIGNNADDDDDDDDDDGVKDIDDFLPLDASEQYDTDGDRIGNNADPDDDNDGVDDTNDAFPLDASESVDSDGDGVGDNGDAFPNDASENADSDNDGVGDNADNDADNDGVSNVLESQVGPDSALARQLNASRNKFVAANSGQWVSVTRAEYDAIASNVNGAARFGTPESYVRTGTLGSFAGNVMYTFGQTNNPSSQNVHIVAFKRGTTIATQGGNDQVRVSSVNNGSGYQALGSVLSNGTVDANEEFWVLKGADTQRFSAGQYLGLSSDENNPIYYQATGTSGGYSAGSTTSVANFSYGWSMQAISVPESGSAGWAIDQDNDGVENYRDLDSDNDSIPDIIELGLSDSDGDGKVDDVNLQGTVTTLPDQDNDGLPDFLDLESNNAANDGTAYDIDTTSNGALDSNNDGQLNNNDTNGGIDANGNGIDDLVEGGVDSDRDGVPDSRDAFPNDPTEWEDSDGDGLGDNGDPFPNDPTNGISNPTACGEPTFDATTERGTFLWSSCDGRNKWYLRTTGAGATSKIVYQGQLTDIKNLVEVSIEGSDVLDLSGKDLSYTLNIFNSGVDGLDFKAGTASCLTPATGQTLPIYVGKDKTKITTASYQLASGQACSTNVRFACGEPSIDSATEQGSFLWADCNGSNAWHLRTTGGGTAKKISYQGSFDGQISGVTNVSVEQSDTVDIANGLAYTLNIFNNGIDGVDFVVTGDSCFTPVAPQLPVFLGASKAVLTSADVSLLKGTSCVAAVDSDGDGLSDTEEVRLGTDPTNADTDGGGTNDGEEIANGTDPLDGNDDAIGVIDSDNDGLSDAQEASLGTDPNNPDTDGERLSDGDEVNVYNTNPLHANTDRDGLNDYVEVTFKNTDPLNADSDGDGLSDGQEASRSGLGTDPNKADTDGGGTNDGDEVSSGTNPLDPSDG